MLQLLLCGLVRPCYQIPSDAVGEQASIWQHLSLYADGRLRAESTFDQLNGEDRHRGRLRLRLGALYDLTDELRAEARLSSAADGADANNPHWDFGDGEDGSIGSNIVLDRFQLQWTPAEEWQLRAGKFGHLFSSAPIVGELSWDADVQPAGVAAQWSKAQGENALSYDVRLAEYVAVENGADSDPAMFGLQGNLYVAAGSSTRIQISSSYAHWSSLNAGADVFVNQGNTDVTGDFSLWESFATATWDGGWLERTTLFVQRTQNLDGDAGEDSGFAAGAVLGKSGQQRDLSIFAAIYDLEANAVFSPVAQDDTPVPGTGSGEGMQGLIAGGQYYLTDNLALKLWVLTSDVGAQEDPWRLRLDLDFKVK